MGKRENAWKRHGSNGFFMMLRPGGLHIGNLAMERRLFTSIDSSIA